VRYGVGVDNVDLKAAQEFGHRVCNVPDYGIEEVADHAVALTLGLARHLTAFDRAIRAGAWKISQIAPSLRSLRDTQVGLIGLGRIARAYATRMQAFGCTIIGYDPAVNAEELEILGIKVVSLEEVLQASQVISLHVPLLPSTRNVLDKDAISRMLPGAILINVSRGGLVDESALAEALNSGHVSGAGLDVFEQEPLPETSPLRHASNILLSPHAAFFSDLSVRNLQRLAAEEASRALRGEPLRCAVV
jgi:D-3-phosphoglycerate dehydrogenase